MILTPVLVVIIGVLETKILPSASVTLYVSVSPTTGVVTFSYNTMVALTVSPSILLECVMFMFVGTWFILTFFDTLVEEL